MYFIFLSLKYFSLLLHVTETYKSEIVQIDCFEQSKKIAAKE